MARAGVSAPTACYARPYCFCTYFDSGYLPRGLALYESLRRHCPAFRLWILCLDTACQEALTRLALPDVHLVGLADLEEGDHDLLQAKQNRSRIEYYFTCTSSLLLFVLRSWSEVDLVTYLDADLFFFADPKPIYDEIGARSIAIIAHRFAERARRNEQYGIYNVGWVSFRRDEQALDCLQWWRERCIAWCYDRIEDGKFADQKYLDDWPSRFRGVAVLQHRGANLAPWNVGNYSLCFHEGRMWVDKQPLIFFHFHGFKQTAPCVYDPNLVTYGVRPRPTIISGIYEPYVATLSAALHRASPVLRKASVGRSIRYQAQGTSWRSRAAGHVRRLWHPIKYLLRGEWVIICRNSQYK